jgi:hypothetical protein
MCCILALLVFIGPRIAAIAWYLTDTARWSATFSNILWPLLGVIFLPWTLLAYVLMAGDGAVAGLWDWIVVGLGFLIDVGAFGSGYQSRRRH